MEFNIDPEMVEESISQALEDAGSQMSEEQFGKVAEAIERSMPGVIQVLAQGMSEYWKSEANNAGGWGTKYAKAIKYTVEGNKAEVYVDEDMVDKGSNKPSMMFVEMIERGMKSFSIKDALLASEKAKEGKDGVRYITVPFPVATPRKSGQGTMQRQFGGREMTAAMHKIVKSGGRLGKGSTLPSGQDVSGLSQYNTRQLHSQYGIFRRVSEKSKGWVHPGRGPSPVYPSVLSEVNKQIQTALKAYCQAIVQEYSK